MRSSYDYLTLYEAIDGGNEFVLDLWRQYNLEIDIEICIMRLNVWQMFAVWFSGLETWTSELRTLRCKLWKELLTITNCPYCGKKTRWEMHEEPLTFFAPSKSQRSRFYTWHNVNIMKILNAIEEGATVLYKALKKHNAK